MLVNCRPARFSFWILKGHHHKRSIIREMTYPNFINSGIRQSAIAFARKMALLHPILENWLSGISRLRKVNLSVTESIADCWKERHSVTLTRQNHFFYLLTSENGFLLILWRCPFKIKIQKEKWPGLQFTRTDYLSLVLTPLRIRWTIPLIYLFGY